MAKIKINGQRCKGCLLCISACPSNLIEVDNVLNKLGLRPASPKKDLEKKCIGCCFCALVCPDACIEVYK